MRFSQAVSLRYMVVEHGSDEKIALVGSSCKNALRKTTYFSNRPSFANRQAMFNKLLQSEAIRRAIEDEAKSKNISIEKAQKEAHKILDEIAADVSHSSLRAVDRFYVGFGINFIRVLMCKMRIVSVN